MTRRAPGHPAAVVSHPCEDGSIGYWPRAGLVRLSAALRSSGLSCEVSAVPAVEDTWEEPAPVQHCTRPGCVVCARPVAPRKVQGRPAVLTIRWGRCGASRGGSLRLFAVEPGPRGCVGSVVDVLPVEGLTDRPVVARPRAEPATRALDVRALRRMVPPPVSSREPSADAADGASVAFSVAWEARERIAREILGADFERVQAA